MRQIITLAVGQSATKVTQQLWNQLQNNQYSFQYKNLKINCSTARVNQNNGIEYPQVYFQEKSSKMTARALFFDLKSTELDNLRYRNHRGIFKQQNILSENTGSSNIWGKGYYTNGQNAIQKSLDSIRRQLQYCDSLQGLQIINSFGGGTGSGYGSRIMHQLAQIYSNFVQSSNIIPQLNGISNNVLQIYNSVFSMHKVVEYATQTLIYDNLSLQKKCLKNQDRKINTKDYKQINQQMAASILGTTASSRYSGNLNNNLLKMSTNLIPFPRMHFFSVTHTKISKPNLNQLISSSMNRNNTLCQVDHSQGRFFTIGANIRSNFSTYQIQTGLFKQRDDNADNFFEWIPDNFNLGMCNNVPKKYSAESTFLFNTSAMRQPFQKLGERFTELFRRKSFVHWYINEGMDEMEFTQAQSNLNDLVSEYPWNYEGDFGYMDEEIEDMNYIIQ